MKGSDDSNDYLSKIASNESNEEIIKTLLKKLDETTQKLDEKTQKLDETTQKLDETTQKLDETTQKLDESTQKLEESQKIIKKKDEKMKKLIPNLNNIESISNEIKDYKLKLPNDVIEKIQTIQDLLKNCGKSNNSIEVIHSFKQNFDYKFGNEINNTMFIDYMNKSIQTLYSWSSWRRKGISDFFNSIEIDDFLYIPMITDDLLSKFKKHLFLGVINNQAIPMRLEVIKKFLLYTNEDFKERPFNYTLEIELNREEKFSQNFNDDYSNHCEIKINVETLKDYIFSNVIIEAYILTAKEVFGSNATFVNEKNTKMALEIIYNDIIKNLKICNLQKDIFGVTLYSKNIIIADCFEQEFGKSKNEREKLVFLGMFLIVILHEIMHCLTNILPSFEKQYEKLQNPFIRSYKKRLDFYNYVTGINTNYNNKDEIKLLSEENDKGDIIRDSGNLFENILFKGEGYNKFDYLKAEYLFNKNNLAKTVENFNKGYEDFVSKYNKLNLSYLNMNTGHMFKGKCNFRTCLLSPYEWAL
jgi:molecular chaperone GrpE (heat shock protein)